MMADVVTFPGRGTTPQATEPHLSGEAFCSGCGYEWMAVAPVGTVHLDCPQCDRRQGLFKHAVEPDTAWTCNCGNRLFWLTKQGAMCRTCGIISSDWAD